MKMATNDTSRLAIETSQLNQKTTQTSYGSDFRSTSPSSSVNQEGKSDHSRPRISESEWFPVTFILAFAFFITIVEHGVRFNIVLYSEEVLGSKRRNAPVLIDVFDAVAPCLPLIGGWLGDSWFQRLNVIVTGTIITLLGIILLTLNVAPYSDDVEANFSVEVKRGLFVTGFAAIFVGLALYQANAYVIAARQIERRANSALIRNLFLVFYGVYFTAIFSSELLFQLIDSTSFFVVYLLLVAFALAAVCAVLLGRNLFVTEDRMKHILWKQFQIIWEGMSRRKDAPHVRRWIHRAAVKYGGTFENTEVYSTGHLLRTIPIFHTVTIFIIVNYFIGNTYSKQTLRLQPSTDTSGTLASLMYHLYKPIISLITNIITLVVLMPPCFDRHRRCISPFVRIGVGISFGILSIVFAAIVELKRKQLMEEGDWNILVIDDNVTLNASSLNVISQLPQYTCAGIGEALVLTAGLEVSYAEAPCYLKGFTVGLFLLMSGVGSYLLAQLIVIIVNSISGAAGHQWYTDEINSGHLEYFYFLLAAILLLDIVYLFLVTRTYARADWGNVVLEECDGEEGEDELMEDCDEEGGDDELMAQENKKEDEDQVNDHKGERDNTGKELLKSCHE